MNVAAREVLAQRQHVGDRLRGMGFIAQQVDQRETLLGGCAHAIKDPVVAHPKRSDGVQLGQGAAYVFGALASVQSNLVVTEEGGVSTQFVHRRRTRGPSTQAGPLEDQRYTLAFQRLVIERRAGQFVDAGQIVVALVFNGDEVSGHCTTSVVGMSPPRASRKAWGRVPLAKRMRRAPPLNASRAASNLGRMPSRAPPAARSSRAWALVTNDNADVSSSWDARSWSTSLSSTSTSAPSALASAPAAVSALQLSNSPDSSTPIELSTGVTPADHRVVTMSLRTFGAEPTRPHGSPNDKAHKRVASAPERPTHTSPA